MKTKPSRIAVVGCGHVGLVMAAGLAELGHDVYGLDRSKELVDRLMAGDVPDPRTRPDRARRARVSLRAACVSRRATRPRSRMPSSSSWQSTRPRPSRVPRTCATSAARRGRSRRPSMGPTRSSSTRARRPSAPAKRSSRSWPKRSRIASTVRASLPTLNSCVRAERSRTSSIRIASSWAPGPRRTPRPWRGFTPRSTPR